MFWWHREVSPGIWVAFTDTRAGNLALSVGDTAQALANRAMLARELGIGPSGLTFMSQVHGNEVADLDAEDVQLSDVDEADLDGAGESDAVRMSGPGQSGSPTCNGPTADAMVSGRTPLAVLVADCVPVVLVGTADGVAPVLAVAHAGRAGVANAVVSRTVDAMRGRGATVIRAWLGPSVCGSCYEVPEGMRTELAAIEPDTFSVTGWGTPALDLPAGVLSQLAAAGVAAERIAACTMEEPELFSHRRDAAAGTPGRFAGVVYARH